jgi:hypothetical protein
MWEVPTDQRKQAKLQWLQDPSEINGDNLNNARCEASRYFRNTKNLNIGIHEFKRGTNREIT